MKLPEITTPMDGRTVVITGASSGIGTAAARKLAALGARVIVVGRSAARTEAIAREIGGEAVRADYADLASVRAAAARILVLAPEIDVLANNAGGSWPKRELTRDEHEMMFQVNHLAPFLLTELLRAPLAAAKGRVINTSSAFNAMGKVDLDDLESTKRFRSIKVYGTTKLENILHARELARRWGSEGVSTASFHPGIVATQFGRNSRFSKVLFRIAKWFMRTPEEGADTLIWLASAVPGVDWQSGDYYVNRRVGQPNGQVGREPELARDLYERSKMLIAAQSEL